MKRMTICLAFLLTATAMGAQGPGVEIPKRSCQMQGTTFPWSEREVWSVVGTESYRGQEMQRKDLKVKKSKSRKDAWNACQEWLENRVPMHPKPKGKR